MKKEKVIIVGVGAQAKYIVDAITYYPHMDIEAIVTLGENMSAAFEKDVAHIKMVNAIGDIKEIIKRKAARVIVAVSDNDKKRMLIAEALSGNMKLTNIIHPRAVVSEKARLGCNILVNAGAVIQPYASVGDGAMIHANAVIEHDCTVHEYVNIAMGAQLAGWVIVKKGAYIYTGATVLPSVTIGEHAIVGAGAVVVKDVPNQSTVVGNPAQVVKVQ